MTAQLAVFFVLAVLAVIGAVSLILQKHPIHSALSLIVVIDCPGGPVSAVGSGVRGGRADHCLWRRDHGAVRVRDHALECGIEEHTSISKMAGAPGLLLVVALAGFVAATIARSTENIQATSQTGVLASTLGISNMLFKDFVYPFELTSFLILVAVLGATVLAQREKS